MKKPLLYYITDSQQLPPSVSLLEQIRDCFDAGLDYVQIREKSWTARRLAQLVTEAAAIPRSGRLLVNDRLDVALGCGADGVHFPANRIPANQVRPLTAEGFLIGISCHSQQEVEQAAAEGADYALLGPIFPTPGKSRPLGLQVLHQAARVAIPVVALGGIDAQNAWQCIMAGADGVAGIRLFQKAINLAQLVSELHGLK